MNNNKGTALVLLAIAMATAPAAEDVHAADAQLSWTRRAIETGTVVDAASLWPDASSPVITAVYRNGASMQDCTEVTIADGSVYHFRGKDGTAVLYTQVYPDAERGTDVSAGITGSWYSLLPSIIRTEFEEAGWTWAPNDGNLKRARLDRDGKRVLLKDSDGTAVLYGMGLYLDQAYGYGSDPAVEQERASFREAFGQEDEIFARALELYFTKSGELKSTCPKLYALAADAMYQLDDETTRIRLETKSGQPQGTAQPEQPASTQPPAQPLPSTKPSTNPSSGQTAQSDKLLSYVNSKRSGAGLPMVSLDEANASNVRTRVQEVSGYFSQERPDGSDAFSAYTEDVMNETRLENISGIEDIYSCAEDYFLMDGLQSFAYAMQGDVAVVVFTW